MKPPDPSSTVPTPREPPRNERAAALLAGGGTTGPLSREQIAQIVAAKRELAPILKGQKVAQRTAGGLISAGILTAILAFFGTFSITALVMGLWMIVAGFIEHWQGQHIHYLKPEAFTILIRNQLLLGAMFVILGLWWMLEVRWGWMSATEKKEIQSVITAMSSVGGGAGEVRSLITSIEYIAYGSIVILGLCGQGWLSFYYWQRRNLLKKYLVGTPEWIISLQRHDTV
ncbi:MAG: hypothetical protein HKL95_09355 [Phycisphaerae bacterium]|nr:hypothetical protein [Phycisphaerae bacterium]